MCVISNVIIVHKKKLVNGLTIIVTGNDEFIYLFFKIDECYKQFKIGVSKPFQDGINVSLKKLLRAPKLNKNDEVLYDMTFVNFV